MKTIKEIDLGDVLHKALTLYTDNGSLFLGLAACALSPAILQSFLNSTNVPLLGAIATMLIPVTVTSGILFLMASLILASKSSAGEEGSFGIVLSEAWPKIVLGLLAYASFASAVILGIILIVPSIYILGTYCFILKAILFEDKNFFDAWKRSKELVRGRFWNVLFAHFMMFLIAFLVMTCMYIGNAFIGIPSMVTNIVAGALGILIFPMMVCFYFCLYTELRTSLDSSVSISVYNKS